MYGVELYAAVRLAVVDEGLSHHEAGRRFGIDRRTVKKMLSYSAPPGYRRTKPVRRPKLDGFTGIVDAILEADTDPDAPRKQRHTAHRIFERLRDEHGFTGGYTIVKDYVRARRQSTREAFVPLHHPPCPYPGDERRQLPAQAEPVTPPATVRITPRLSPWAHRPSHARANASRAQGASPRARVPPVDYGTGTSCHRDPGTFLRRR